MNLATLETILMDGDGVICDAVIWRSNEAVPRVQDFIC